MNRPPCLHAKGSLLLQAIVILLAGYWVFSPALHGDWLWNDKSFLAESSLVRDPGGLWRIWFARQGPDYFPLRTSVQWVQWRLAGDDPFGYHLTNLGLQILSAFLLWRLLYKLGIRWAALGALLLVVHPLMVERVAWIAELKSALALPFFLAAFLAYLRHESRGGGLRDPCYLLSLACFLAALLNGSSAMILPGLLLLHAWWKHGRVTADDWREISPFVATALVVGVIMMSLRSNSNPDADAAALAGGFLGLTWVKGHLASLLVTVLIGWGAIAVRDGRSAGLRVLFCCGVAIGTIALARASRGDARVFANNETFWTYALEHHPDSAEVRYNLGLVRVSAHQLPEAIDRFAEALQLRPDYADAETNLAIALCVAGRMREAIPHFARSLQLNPNDAQARYNFGLALRAVGRPAEARAQWEEAARLNAENRTDAP